MEARVKKQIKKLIDEGLTEAYVNTVLHLNPTSWDLRAETFQLCEVLEKLEKEGIIKIN